MNCVVSCKIIRVKSSSFVRFQAVSRSHRDFVNVLFWMEEWLVFKGSGIIRVVWQASMTWGIFFSPMEASKVQNVCDVLQVM